ncbi:MAG: hypothetical protein JWR37_4961 [Mycobacterium sp.]|nr:hypothetical protein [Mycobacterium sp.]
MADAFIDTRRQLRGIAESLIAGPQFRTTGTIRLAVRPHGFTGTTVQVEVNGTELHWSDGRAPLKGPLSRLAEAAGLQAGPPTGLYEIADPLDSDAELDIDRAQAEYVYRCLYAGGHALKTVLPEEHPVLWPEHFDVSVTQDEVNYGVSAGDSYHPEPYAYVGPWTPRTGPFWNAPFGAWSPLDADSDADTLTAGIVHFFAYARKHL